MRKEVWEFLHVDEQWASFMRWISTLISPSWSSGLTSSPFLATLSNATQTILSKAPRGMREVVASSGTTHVLVWKRAKREKKRGNIGHFQRTRTMQAMLICKQIFLQRHKSENCPATDRTTCADPRLKSRINVTISRRWPCCSLHRPS
ncbi:hypothetical protein JHK86_000761 [Glycine max]|nr:hypothetical protein JHK86_000761 [Glycine max]